MIQYNKDREGRVTHYVMKSFIQHRELSNRVIFGI